MQQDVHPDNSCVNVEIHKSIELGLVWHSGSSMSVLLKVSWTNKSLHPEHFSFDCQGIRRDSELRAHGWELG